MSGECVYVSFSRSRCSLVMVWALTLWEMSTPVVVVGFGFGVASFRKVIFVSIRKLATPKPMPTTTTGVDICQWVSAQTMTKLHWDLENATFTISPGMHQYKPNLQAGRDTLSARCTKVALTETFPETILRKYLEF